MWDIHEIEEADLAAVGALEGKIFTDAWSALALRETCRRIYSVMVGAYKDESLVGYAILYCVPDDAEIVRIAVADEHRREGAAGRMVIALEQKCKERGIGRLLLDVRAGNEAAIALYKKFGFTEDGLRKDYYLNPSEDAVLMSKSIV